MRGGGFVVGLVLLLQGQLQAAPMIVAHRGASHDAPENTLPAFELAWRQGADAIEGDFYLTRDGRIVCIHDADTGRVAGTKLIVQESTLEELHRLDVGAWRGGQWSGTKIPTIAEVLGTVPGGKRVFLEIKSGPVVIPRLIEEIKVSGLTTEQVTVISFDAGVIAAMKGTAPQYKAFWLASLRRDDAGGIAPSSEALLATLRRIGADGLSVGHRHLDAPLVRRIIDAGFEFHVWTVDDAAMARTFLQWGVMSITSNAPGFIKAQLFAPQ